MKPVRSWVYFIREEEDGPIKIGWAVNPVKRLGDLQTGNPRVLRIIGTCPGGVEHELALQREVSDFRIRGEWFRPTLEVLALVARCTAEGYDWERYETDRMWAESRAYWPRDEGLGPAAISGVQGSIGATGESSDEATDVPTVAWEDLWEPEP